MTWTVRFAAEFLPEFQRIPETVRIELLARLRLLEQFGPQLGRPHVDTLKGSRHTNMKELRFSAAGGVWRVAFAFDSRREAIVLAAGSKTGIPEARFYKQLLTCADHRFSLHRARAASTSTRH